jgi:hypothetical protein
MRGKNNIHPRYVDSEDLSGANRVGPTVSGTDLALEVNFSSIFLKKKEILFILN